MANNAEVNALLGKGSEFEGKLTFEGTVRIDGKFEGEVFSDDTLIIGEGARVKAEINVSTVLIYGDVIGNVSARTAVELHAPARLKGNISAPSLVVEQGVVFDGNCKMTDIDRRDGGKVRPPGSGPDAARAVPAPGKPPTSEPTLV